MSRAVGETMVVAIAAGAGPRNFNSWGEAVSGFSFLNPFKAAETMTGHIVRISGGDLSYDSVDYDSIFAIALMLFFMTMVLNVISRWIVRRFRQESDEYIRIGLPTETKLPAFSRRARPTKPLCDVASAPGSSGMAFFFAASLTGILVLSVLLVDIINDVFGYIAIQYEVQPETLTTRRRTRLLMLHYQSSPRSYSWPCWRPISAEVVCGR